MDALYQGTQKQLPRPALLRKHFPAAPLGKIQVTRLEQNIKLSFTRVCSMDDLLEMLLEKTPKCFSNFNSSRISIQLPTTWNTGPQFVTKAIQCKCGNEDLYLEAAQHKQMKGVCRKQELITLAPPVYISCKPCKSFRLLFNPLIHGWKGEMDESDNSDSAYTLISCTVRPGRVYVNYSYQNIQNYEQLINNGIENPEDYFDTFTVFHRNPATEDIKEIVSVVLQS